jgi:hypothetical protein
MFTSALVLAQLNPNSATDTARNFFNNTDLGDLLTTVLGSIGLLLILWSLVKAFKNIVMGQIAPAIKNVIAAVFVAVFLFSPAQFGRLIDVASRAIDVLLSTFGGIVGA